MYTQFGTAIDAAKASVYQQFCNTHSWVQHVYSALTNPPLPVYHIPPVSVLLPVSHLSVVEDQVADGSLLEVLGPVIPGYAGLLV